MFEEENNKNKSLTRTYTYYIIYIYVLYKGKKISYNSLNDRYIRILSSRCI